MMKSGEDGSMKIQHAIGQFGEVYLAIPSKRSGLGKIQVKVTGSLRTLDAMTDDEVSLQTGQIIKVIQVVNDNILLVTQK